MSIRCQHSLPLQSSLGKLLFWISCSRTVTLNWKTLVAEACEFPLMRWREKAQNLLHFHFSTFQDYPKISPNCPQIIRSQRDSLKKGQIWRGKICTTICLHFASIPFAILSLDKVAVTAVRICMLQSPAFQIRPAVQQLSKINWCIVKLRAQPSQVTVERQVLSFWGFPEPSGGIEGYY